MLVIRFDVKEINYEECFENLIPQMIEQASSQTELTEVEKLLVRLDSDAVPVLLKLLKYLDTDARDQLFVWLLEEHQDMFVSTANSELQDLFEGDAIVIGGLCGKDMPGPRIMLYATKVKIDYKKLVDSPVLSGGILGGAAKLAVQISKPETIEKRGMSLLSSDLMKPTLISTLSDSLKEAGLSLTLGDVEIVEEHEIELPGPIMDPNKDEGLLPDAFEDKIIDGIAAWLKDSL